VTTSSRSKEEENDYRYFPEPDLFPLRVSSWVETIELPELPDARRERFMAQYGCSLEHAKTLTGGIKLAEFFEEVAKVDPTLASTWTADTLLGELNYRDFTIDAMPARHFAELLTTLKEGTITDKSAIEIIRVMLDAVKEGKKPEMPSAVITRLGLAKTSGSEIPKFVQEALDENPQPVQDYFAGKSSAINFLVGQVMKKCRGRADPGELNALLKVEIEKRRG
jgi:aspartyl-tRNA(Asn)/glutamyl-tRNA(Gln) amidotransferase subunit B